MSLRDVQIKKEYRSLLDNVAKEFYVPLLSQAISYKRAVGFFSSTALVSMTKGIAGLVKNGGKIQLIASPYLSDEDIEAIRAGYSRRQIINKALLKGLKEPANEYQQDRLNLLANLIADGILDIRIAITENNSYIGMYHEKMGIIEDSDGNKVAFAGSMNETLTAQKYSYETIDVFTSWSDDRDRVEIKECSFAAIWANNEPNLRTMDFDDVSDEFIKKYRKKPVDYSTVTTDQDVVPEIEHEYSFFKIPTTVEFYDYQKEAIEAWIKRGCCGIYDMATGSGKTYTALGSITKLSQILNEQLAIVIVAPYQHLVEQWVEDINKFNVSPIIAYSYPGQKWRKQFEDAVNAYNVGAIKHFCVISTNATFSTDDFQRILLKFKKNYLFVVDEAHNFGSKKLGALLPKKARYRLALSATIERYRDEEGTAILKKYFGSTPCISFTLKDAIQKGFLTSYYYYPVVCYLDADELERYNDLTRLIIKNGGASKENTEKNPYVEMLLIKRARIISGCKDKVAKLIEAIEPYKKEKNILVYCGATKYDNDKINDDDDVRQIEEVNGRLYHELGMKVHKFTSSESKEEREDIKRRFASGDLQVVTAIKCLDEGVNIPAIQKAFILASSTNPKEYIQRRGRVLRRAKGKEYAEIFDFITLPRKLDTVQFCDKHQLEADLSLVRKEFNRMLDFAETARNPLAIDDLKEKIQLTYNQVLNGGYFDE